VAAERARNPRAVFALLWPDPKLAYSRQGLSTSRVIPSRRTRCPLPPKEDWSVFYS
jgi:hypothetical protein